jgi:hypothetical protein
MQGRRISIAIIVSVVLGASLVVGLSGPASADGPSLTVSSVARNGGTATVVGKAIFPAISSAQNVGGEDTDWASADVAAQTGIDLQEGRIVPLADGSGLRFIWSLAGLPAQIPPEAVRYTWAVTIGDKTFQLQAKRTNMASITTAEDPVNHVKQLASQQPFFQLRGACEASYQGTPTSGCYHLAFLKGAFDATNKTVSIDWPYNTRDQIGRLVAPEFHPGAVLAESQQAGMSIAAAFQAVIGNTSTSDYINGWSSYFVGPQVSLGIGANDADPSDPQQVTWGNNLTLGGDGTFTGSISGLDATNPAVFIRACNGESCAYAKA